jgi:hypothetical protein
MSKTPNLDNLDLMTLAEAIEMVSKIVASLDE